MGHYKRLATEAAEQRSDDMVNYHASVLEQIVAESSPSDLKDLVAHVKSKDGVGFLMLRAACDEAAEDATIDSWLNHLKETL